MSVVTLLAATPTVTPDATFFGTNVATSWMNGIAYLALIMVIIGLVLSAGLWAIGAFSNNYTQSVNGKKGFLICAAAALVIGAANTGISYFYKQGASLNGQ